MWYNIDMRKLMETGDGLRLVVAENPAVRSVAAGVFVKAGAVNETPEQAGISHLIEHMAFKGTDRRSVFDVVNDIDSIGAQINAYTSKTHTCFYTLSRDVHLGECLDVLADITMHPRFAPDDLKRERKVVLEEISESEDTPDDICLENLSAAFFEGHPLGNRILGSRDSLKGLTADDLHAYRNKFYVPSNIVVSVCGNVTVAEAEKLVREKFPAAGLRVESPSVPLVRANHAGGFVHKTKRIEQAHLSFAFPGKAYNTYDNTVLHVLSAVFGLEMSSRLFQSVREKLGLCYSISGYPSSYENNGSFIIYTSVNPSNVERAVVAVRKEIDRLLADNITEEELVKGKEQMKTGLVLGQESTSATMRAFGRHAITTNELYDIDSQIQKVDSVKLEDIERVAAEVFDFDRMTASLVGAKTVDTAAMMKNG